MEHYTLAFIADIHLFSEKLGNTGRAYDLRQGSDQKCLAESAAVTDAVFEKLAKSEAQAVCIVGDLTNDGEKFSHEEISEKISRLNSVKKTYPIVSTHDWCSDHNPRRFEGKEVFNDVEVLSPAQLNELYGKFGENECISSYTTPLGLVSKCFQVSDTLRLIAVHDDCDGKNGKSGYSEEHLKWMLQMLENAKKDNCKVIAFEHHLMLYPFCKLVNRSQCIADNFEIAETLADAGLRLIITGHSHMQRTTEFVSKKGNKITQINLGALTGYPSPVTYIDFDGENANVNVEFTNSFTYNNHEYGTEFFKEHTLGVLFNLINAGKTDKDDFYERLISNGIKIPSYNILYPFIRFACKKLSKATCGKAGKLINSLTHKKAFDKQTLEKVKDMPLLDLVSKIFLAVFDGSYIITTSSQEERELIRQVGNVPLLLVQSLPIKKQTKEKLNSTLEDIRLLLEELANAPAPDNMKTVIAL